MATFYYLTENETIIRIKKKQKPSAKTCPRSGTWVIEEYSNNSLNSKWGMPCFPEITWNRLSQLTYIGKTK